MFISIPNRAAGLIKPPLGTQINWNHPLSTGLLACYLLNEGGGLTAYNSAGGNNGTLTGTPPWITAKYGSGVSVNGSTQYIACGPITTGLSGSFSFAAWVYPTTETHPTMGIVVSEVASYSNFWANLLLTNSYQAKFELYDGTHNPGASASTDVLLNTWNHLVGVRDHTAGVIYVYTNGVRSNGASDTTTSLPAYSAFNLGAQVNVVNREWAGTLDNVLVYNRALSQAEIQQLYAQPFCFMQPPRLYSVDVPGAVTPSLIYMSMIG